MRRKGLYLLACVFLLMVGCISNAEQKKAEASEGVLYVPVLNQTEGQKVIESLSKAYGDNPNVTGDFIGSIRCPYFLEGHYFDGNTLVLQVRGDF